MSSTLPAVRDHTLVIRDEGHYLATCAEVRALTERIESVGDAKALADKAAAAKVWAERAHLGEEQVNLAAIAKLWAERRAGELLILSRENGERATGGANEIRERGELPSATLHDLGLTKHESSRFQKLAAVPADDFEQALDDQAAQGPVTTAGTLRRLDVHFSSKTDQWATPQDLFDQLDAEFGFTLDVCATFENAKCDRYFTAEDDGLAQQWTGVCWMNPPYGEEIGQWVEKARLSSTDATVACLVPARVDTAWWWNNCRFGEVRFLRGRLKFGDGSNSAPFPSAVVVFGPDVTAKTVYWER